ncbi:MAG: hypothetical protein HY912_20035 [Desulfomonile tiedjei]|jgi:hypothetical protein|uniref:Uncharacterized protein n=1 Tax=Desulfomonile tiedjei TaxID=2358 RepID=A0A9D6Z578_9BACT|nr:hypothetical protein [Desulfomonile tiedjei]
MGSLRKLRTAHTNYLPRFEVPALTRGTSEEMEVFVKKVWQWELLERVRKHPATTRDLEDILREVITEFGDVTVCILASFVEQRAWLKELEEQGYISISRDGMVNGADIYTPRKLTVLEQRIIDTLGQHKKMKGSTIAKRLKRSPEEVGKCVGELWHRKLVEYDSWEFPTPQDVCDLRFSLTKPGRAYRSEK